MPRKGPELKDSQESMEIIEAYDLFGSYNGAAQFCGCSANTVKKLVQARNAGQLRRQAQYERRPKATDKFAAVAEEAIDKSKGKIRAKQIHTRLVALGYTGSMRHKEAAIMPSYTRGERCLMELLAEALDDPYAEPCQRCSVCIGHLPAPWYENCQAATVARVTKYLRSQTAVVSPRKIWPGGGYGARGKIASTDLAEEGHAIFFADAP